MPAQQHFDHSFGSNAPENYERYFVAAIGRPLAVELVESAALRPGERVVDVGCGTGIVARLAADRVQPGGKVAGVDVNPGMIGVARKVVPQELGVEWHEASAESMPLPDEGFDVAFCQMSLQFMPDRQAALREMRRVLAPGGRVALNVPGPVAPVFEALADAMGRHVGPQAAGFVRQVFSMSDTSEIGSLLDEAQFQDVRVEAEDKELILPAPRDFLWQYVYGTPLVAAVLDTDDETRAALEADVVGRWESFAHEDGMRYQQRLVVATARK